MDTLELSFFNQVLDIGILPDTLTKLSVGPHFNHPIAPGVLPSSLTTLLLGYCFNQPLGKDVLPPGLQELSFGDNFKMGGQVELLPRSLRRLSLRNLHTILYLQPALFRSACSPLEVSVTGSMIRIFGTTMYYHETLKYIKYPIKPENRSTGISTLQYLIDTFNDKIIRPKPTGHDGDDKGGNDDDGNDGDNGDEQS
ncbi:hypothetical protein SAMD00019534_096300 [Acytostelium subglobosum LB1]|uniref:hypothetical protein n=1 Tax=Acytostelium subglobosum LB1 TaxID=1410327 RepID=UPI00064482B2|nr:hypothetical protein SAMD00019534_096300 [Acytostelium subglobosum LB1]GAM26455.1 hypothetical protein SAMD00019534_096300 [Acytostelium subglobosum LB1]|eukprot:XP_012750551.1 hypothetical protein SAMD00019534_096300 [Acytostelium subglobosum LB1]